MKSFFRESVLIAIVLVINNFSFAQKSWDVDNVHSSVRFSVSHMKISEVTGVFNVFEGTILASKADFTDAQISFTVDVASISTDNEMRDKHLQSDDFFNAEKFPKMTFISFSLKKINDNKYELLGDLTIRSTTKRVSFDVFYGGTIRDNYGKTRAGFKATTVINRFDYGLKWSQLIETGELVAGKEVTITLNLEFVEQK